MTASSRNAALAAATAVCAALAIASAPWALSMTALNFIFKPLATLFIIAHAWPRGRQTPALRRWLLLGLGLSWLGDVALLWPQAGFLPGLVAFLLAHAAYLMAFTRVQRLAARSLPFVFYAATALLILWQLWPGVPAALRVPVLLYVVCLTAMAAQAAVLWQTGTPRGRLLAAGGALFVISDSLLASNRFGSPLPMSGLWILVSYWLAQWCIASWLEAPPAPRDQARV